MKSHKLPKSTVDYFLFWSYWVAFHHLEADALHEAIIPLHRLQFSFIFPNAWWRFLYSSEFVYGQRNWPTCPIFGHRHVYIRIWSFWPRKGQSPIQDIFSSSFCFWRGNFGAPEFPCQKLTGKKIHLTGKEYFSLSNLFFPVRWHFSLSIFFSLSSFDFFSLSIFDKFFENNDYQIILM